jgi:hypothetical protein
MELLLHCEDPGSMLDAFAHLLRGVMHRAGLLQHVLASSALVDEDAAEMLEVTRRQGRTRQSRILCSLARRKGACPRIPTTPINRAVPRRVLVTGRLRQDHAHDTVAELRVWLLIKGFRPSPILAGQPATS